MGWIIFILCIIIFILGLTKFKYDSVCYDSKGKVVSKCHYAWTWEGSEYKSQITGNNSVCIQNGSNNRIKTM